MILTDLFAYDRFVSQYTIKQHKFGEVSPENISKGEHTTKKRMLEEYAFL
jgi:hypothetical protein